MRLGQTTLSSLILALGHWYSNLCTMPTYTSQLPAVTLRVYGEHFFSTEDIYAQSN